MSDTSPVADRPPVLVSACLLGLPTRYDCASCARPELQEPAGGRCLVPVCPEQLGGLPTPRAPSQIEAGDGYAVLDGDARVVAESGADVTARFLSGAESTAQLAGLVRAREAWRKEGSPSCGVSRIRRNGRDAPGPGITTALLQRKGMHVVGIE